MYCKKCGKWQEDDSIYCTGCGEKLDREEASSNSREKILTDPSIQKLLFLLIGFSIPLVGLILYLVYKNKQPDSAKYAAIGAVTGIVVKFARYILLIVLSIVFSIPLLRFL